MVSHTNTSYDMGSSFVIITHRRARTFHEYDGDHEEEWEKAKASIRSIRTKPPIYPSTYSTYPAFAISPASLTFSRSFCTTSSCLFTQLLQIPVGCCVPAIQEPCSRRTQLYGHSTGQLQSILCIRLPEIRCHIGVDDAWMEGNCRDILILSCSVGCELEIRELGDGVA